MDVLLITLSNFNNINDDGIYSDLMREFKKAGHKVTVFCLNNIEDNVSCQIRYQDDKCIVYHINTGSIQKTSTIKKGINTFLVDYKLKKVTKALLKNQNIDILLYSTPPITITNTVKYLKNKKHCHTYLMLKDIFPQNALDIGLLKRSGIKGLLFRYFRKKEIKLYKLSDYIGCMSNANINYIIENNKYLDSSIVELCPNSIDCSRIANTCHEVDAVNIRNKYSLPLNKKIFVYGGNLGKPQGIEHVINCFKSLKANNDIHFLVVGSGTEYSKLEQYISDGNDNLTLLKYLPNDEYIDLLSICDVALIFLDYRFTIPNYPSRLLDYMKCGLPILSCTDSSTDVRNTIVNGGFGVSCLSNNVDDFVKGVQEILKIDKEEVKNKEFEYLNLYFNVQKTYYNIINHFKKD